MHSIDALMKVEDAHVSMLERVSSYYGRYVDTMWSVFVLHSKSVLGEDWWPSHVELFRSEYEGHISLEHELCRIIDREDGLNARVALDELHDELESRVLIELLAQRGMTVDMDMQLRWLSSVRLARHAVLRKQVRYDIDTARFYVSDAAAKHERQFAEAPRAARGSLRLMSKMYPHVVPF